MKSLILIAKNFVLLAVATSLIPSWGADLLANPKVVSALGEIVKEASGALITKVEVSVVHRTPEYITQKLTLHHEHVGRMSFLKRDPIQKSARPRPLIFILSGLQSGGETLDVVPARGEYSVVSMEYPIDRNLPYGDAVAQAALDFFKIQAQIITSYVWLRNQPDVDTTRTAFLNVSFGNFVAPTALRVLGQVGLHPQATIFAYGSADYFSVLNEQIIKSSRSIKERNAAMDLSRQIEAYVKPNQHLKFLKGPFLVVYGLRDELIPVRSIHALVEHLQGPKTVVPLDVGHIQMDSRHIIEKTFDVVFDWLSVHL